MFDIVNHTLSAPVAQNGTFTVSYPTGKGAGSYAGGHKHKMAALQTVFEAPTGMTVSFGASNITVTYKGATTLPAGTSVVLELDMYGSRDDNASLGTSERTAFLKPVVVDLGTPITADADGICEAQNIGTAGDLSINGALADGGEVVLDVPRNVVVDSGGADTAVLTVYGYDEYGVAMRESITLNGTTAVAGKKAFKRITRVAASAAIANSAFVGTGDVLGLPVYLPGAGYVIAELQDGAAATAGTVVAGSTAAPSATTGDVRGTYDPNAAADGAKNFRLVLLVEDPNYKGLAQYNG